MTRERRTGPLGVARGIKLAATVLMASDGRMRAARRVVSGKFIGRVIVAVGSLIGLKDEGGVLLRSGGISHEVRLLAGE